MPTLAIGPCRFATLGRVEPGVFHRLLDECVNRTLVNFNAQGLSNMMWACATVEHRHPAFFEAVAHQVGSRMRSNHLMLHLGCVSKLPNSEQ